MQEEEEVLQYKAGIRARLERLASEKEPRMEKKEEEASLLFSSASLLHLRLGSRNRLQAFVATPEISFCRRGVSTMSRNVHIYTKA